MEEMTDKSDTTTTSPAKRVAGSAPAPSAMSANDIQYYQTLFMTSALSMSWQLALVVIVPIVGGHMLDDHYHTTPWLTLGGLAVAVIGMFGVLTKTLSEANARAAAMEAKKGQAK